MTLPLSLPLSLSFFSASSTAIVHAVSFTGAVLLFKLPLYILVRLLKGRRVASFTLPSHSVYACVRVSVCESHSLSLFSLLFSCSWRFHVLSHRRLIYCSLPVVVVVPAV